MKTKNLKLKVICGGILGITIISIISALLLDCTEYGIYIAFFDVVAIFLWILVGNSISNDIINTMKKYEKN